MVNNLGETGWADLWGIGNEIGLDETVVDIHAIVGCHCAALGDGALRDRENERTGWIRVAYDAAHSSDKDPAFAHGRLYCKYFPRTY